MPAPGGLRGHQRANKAHFTYASGLDRKTLREVNTSETLAKAAFFRFLFRGALGAWRLAQTCRDVPEKD